MGTVESLIAAINEKRKIEIVYHGGSQPGAVRQITPQGIKDGKVRAFCHTSDAMKLFAVDKISIVDSCEQTDLVAWQPGLQPSRRYTSIVELVEEKRESLVKQGWHIESSENCVALHRVRKNGTPLKGSDVSLDFEEYTHDLIMDEEGEIHEENVRKKQRPWTVRAKNKDTRTYRSLDVASGLFLEWASLLAPKDVAAKP
jgi:hypothetical protein